MFLLLPFGTDREARHIPFVTYCLIGINCLVFLAQINSSDPEGVVHRFGFIPADVNAVSWFTYMFLHGSFFHLAGNMLYLWLFGSALEGVMGWWLYLPTYLLAGCFAMLLHCLIVRAVDPVGASAPLIGASGAIGGLLGLFALRFYQTKIRMWYIVWLLFLRWGTFAIGSPWFIGFWIAEQLLGAVASTLLPHQGLASVAYWTHIGGFGLGVLYALLVNFQGEGRTEYLLEDAQSALSSGSHARAGDLADRVLKKAPHHHEARLMKARALAHSGNSDLSQQEFEKLLWSYLRRSDHELASHLYLEMRDLFPDLILDARLQFAAASALNQSGRTVESLPAYIKVAQQFPDTQEAQTALLRCAQLYLERFDKPVEASKALEAFFHRYPESHSVGFARQLLSRVEAAQQKSQA